MTSKDIIDNKSEIYECAMAFRRDANFLMTELSQEFSFGLASADSFPTQVYSHKYNNKGKFRNEWTFYFHGAECRFDNIGSGQIIEIIILEKPEFGFLDGYFFFNYMRTTDRFKILAHWFENYINVWSAIELLADTGVLTRVQSTSISRNILAC